MIVAIASGKGGTGKTTVAVNLALALSARDRVELIDCDVEEPNCHIFLKPDIREREPVGIPIPVVDEEKCTGCGECGRFCEYHAIVSLKTTPLVFPELCHGCGGCTKVCPVEAISEVERQIGVVESGRRDGIGFVQGRLNIGQPMSPPLIRAVKKRASTDGITVIDCPPGTSCPVIAAVKGSDFVVLVTEPTPFGLHDLRLAVDMVRELRIPFGVVVNRVGMGDDRVHAFCKDHHIPVLQEIPDDRRVAEAYSRGNVILNALPEYRSYFDNLMNEILILVKQDESVKQRETYEPMDHSSERIQ